LVKNAVPLDARHVVHLVPVAPLHFDATVHKPDHFPSPDNAWSPGIRWQTMRWRGVPLGLRLQDVGTVDAPRVDVHVYAAQDLDATYLAALSDEIVYRYNLALDLAPFYEQCQGDPQLGPVIDRWRGMRPISPGSLYEYLIVAIVLQNAVVRRSIQMMQALLETYGTLLAFDGQPLYAFWAPQELSGATEDALRQLKVGYRAKSILRVTQAFAEGQIDEFTLREAPREVRRAALLDLYGIGPASVGYILFDVFHQWDELNHISPWEQRIYSKLFFDRDPAGPLPVEQLLHTLDERFGAWKMLAVHYLWEDLFWSNARDPIPWLQELIRR
jgi:3-methyladenine DNA glycosylase/8-oxoguanine DNA glycosylase